MTAPGMTAPAMTAPGMTAPDLNVANKQGSIYMDYTNFYCLK
jgi:hypothetical protein